MDCRKRRYRIQFSETEKNGYDGIEFAAEPYTIDQERMVSLLKNTKWNAHRCVVSFQKKEI